MFRSSATSWRSGPRLPRRLDGLAGSSVDGVFTVAGGQDYGDNRRSEVGFVFCQVVKQEDVKQMESLVKAAQEANITLKDLTVLGEVAKTGADSLEDAQKVLNKINFENMPEISRLLDLLGIQLTDLITNPGIFFEFFGDEEKSAILVELPSLLPKFKPEDIEVFLNLQVCTSS